MLFCINLSYRVYFFASQIIPMLIDPTNHGGTDADVFEVICPSLPGYGFSEAAHKKGLMLYLIIVWSQLFKGNAGLGD